MGFACETSGITADENNTSIGLLHSQRRLRFERQAW